MVILRRRLGQCLHSVCTICQLRRHTVVCHFPDLRRSTRLGARARSVHFVCRRPGCAGWESWSDPTPIRRWHPDLRFVFTSHVDDLSSTISGCVNDVAYWMQSNRLQLNPGKTTNSTAPSELWYTSFCGMAVMAALSDSVGPRPSVRSTRQLVLRRDPKYFLPLSVRYSVIADGRRSCRCRSCLSHTF